MDKKNTIKFIDGILWLKIGNAIYHNHKMHEVYKMQGRQCNNIFHIIFYSYIHKYSFKQDNEMNYWNTFMCKKCNKTFGGYNKIVRV